MVRRRFFGHVCPDGTTVVSRIRKRTSYLLGPLQSWSLGENLAWGSGSKGTPRGSSRTWMRSSAHRRAILNRPFRDVGVGVAAGAPVARRRSAADVHDGVRLPPHDLTRHERRPPAWPTSLSADGPSRAAPRTALRPRRRGAPPEPRRTAYDVIDAEQRAELAARSPHNAVSIDLPEDPDGGDRYAHAAALLERMARRGRRRPGRRARALGHRPGLHRSRRSHADAQRLLRARARRGVRPRPIRPHERTHPGPKEDRLRLTRATRANLSPIFSLYSDPDLRAWGALEPATHGIRSARSPSPTAPEPPLAHRRSGCHLHRRWRSPTPSCSSPTAITATRPRASTPTRSAARARTATCSCAWSPCRTRASPSFPRTGSSPTSKGDQEKIEALTATLQGVFRHRPDRGRRPRPTG